MDSISQAALGASIGEAMLGRRIGSKGAILGAVIATIPDLDVVLLPFYGTFQRISIHRGYSHSILFSLVAATLIMLLLSNFRWTSELRMGRLWLFSWLALITHMLLDAFTPYGTQLFMPFSDMRVAFDSITIVDPVYTVPLLTGLLLSLTIFRKYRLRRAWANYLGLIASTIYLFLTLSSKAGVERAFRQSLDDQHLSYERLLTVPVTAANYKWYGVATGPDTLYMGHYSQIKRNEIRFEAIPVNDHLLRDLDADLVSRLKWFAKGFYTVAREGDDRLRFYNLQVDMQGVRTLEDGLAPTAWYYEIVLKDHGAYKLSSRVHRE